MSFIRFVVKQVYESCAYALSDAGSCHSLTFVSAEVIH